MLYSYFRAAYTEYTTCNWHLNVNTIYAEFREISIARNAMLDGQIWVEIELIKNMTDAPFNNIYNMYNEKHVDYCKKR